MSSARSTDAPEADTLTSGAIFERMACALRKQADIAGDLDDTLADLARYLTDPTRAQAVDRLRQSLTGLSVLAANAARVTSDKADVSVPVHDLINGIALEEVRALITPERTPDADTATPQFF